MIHEKLKQLRKKHDLTLKELASKVGYGTGNLSSYENGRVKATDQTLLRILSRGFDMTNLEARSIIALWRKEEFEKNYKLNVRQIAESYNKGKGSKTLDEFLQSEGLDAETIEKIKKDIEFYKKKSK